MPTWPAYAKIILPEFAEQPDPAILRSEMESGPPKQVKVKSRVLVQRPITFSIDGKANYLAFRAWFKSDIRLGADWFDWTDPVDGAVKSARIVGGKVEYRPLNKAFTFWRGRTVLETWE